MSGYLAASFLCAGLLACVGASPLRALSRAIDYARAAGFCAQAVAVVAARTARERWPEAVQRARSER